MDTFDKLLDMYEALEADNKMLAELLEDAANGLEWYFAEFPNVASEADLELHQRIDEALAQRIGGRE